MDLGSFALGLAAGIVVAIAALAALAVVRVRRVAREFPLLVGFQGDARLRPSSTVETDEEDHIIVHEEAPGLR